MSIFNHFSFFFFHKLKGLGHFGILRIVGILNDFIDNFERFLLDRGPTIWGLDSTYQLFVMCKFDYVK